ncbi:MAG: HAD family hydrolase [Spirochaetes bacterium]|nr:HAD family hydrolase [Spirochaetota bacterium]
MMISCDSIIFDMDGTLWDAVETYTRAWNMFFMMHGIEKTVTKEFLDSFMGLEEKLFLEKILPEVTDAERKKFYQEVIILQYALIEQEGGNIFDGVMEGLGRLSEKYKLFIVSNCPRLTIRYFIKWSGIRNLITDSLAHGENFKSKHENIILLKNKHDLKTPVYVGDTDSDRKQSALANVPFVYVDYGFGECSEYAKKFSSFRELTEFFLQNREGECESG